VTPEEYALQQAVITAAVAAFVLQFTKFFARPFLTVADWLGMLRFLYPEVEQKRQQSSALARDFYDSQRAVSVPDLPRHDRLLEPYQFEWFVESMEPLRERFSQENTPEPVMAAFALQVVREVENAGRKQIIKAVKSDEALQTKIDTGPKVRKRYKKDGSKSDLVRGWARVATGDETCAWCLMLVSRGPTYYKASRGGLDLPDWEAQERIAAGEDVSKYMEEWHTGCDCKVIPVFKSQDWDNSVYGKAAERALELWVVAGLRADDELEANPDKVYYSFEKKTWLKTTMNRETINQLRKMIENGEISSQEWAALQVA
jgi:hypothetical protein